MNSSHPDTALPGFERSLAVVIGINSYSHGIPPLQNAVHDASAIADTLEQQGFEVLRLLDADASRARLSQLLSQDLPSLQPAPDRLLLYFAGHGLAQGDSPHQLSGFLLPVDAHRDDSSSYWPMASVREDLSHLPCRHLLLILDCCFAGAFPHASTRDLRAPPSHTPLFLERFRHFSSRRSFQLLVSTSHDELASDRLLAKPSQEVLGSGLHSPFARALLEGLGFPSSADTNRDGLLTASELYTFLRDRLVSLLPSHAQQTPSLRPVDWHDGGEFLFLLSKSFPALPSAAPLSKHSNPYRGLHAFTSEHRHLFFGRERIVDTLAERLDSEPLLVLSGPSGAGKSSLVHAGLLPRLSEQASWRIPPPLRPSSQPLEQLSSWLASLDPELYVPTAESLFYSPDLAVDSLLAFFSRDPGRTLLLVVDPLEELLTACPSEELHRRFLRALSALLHLSHPRFRLLLLLRADFEPRFLSLIPRAAPPLEIWRDHRFLLPPMNREELRRCIQKPAEAHVLFFSPGLVERVLDDVEQMPGALPLLSLALSELFDAYLDSGRTDRTLSLEDYERLGGGIGGVLKRRGEFVFRASSPPTSPGQSESLEVPILALPAFQRALRGVLLRMVSIEGDKLTRRRVLRAELEYPRAEQNRAAQRALSFLEGWHLVVASDDGGPSVEPAHEALLFAWPRLHDWIRDAQRELLLMRRITYATAEWLRHHEAHDFLWADARLDELGIEPEVYDSGSPLALPGATESRSTEPLDFNVLESRFLRASEARRRVLRARRYALAFTAAAGALALVLAILAQVNKVERTSQEMRVSTQTVQAARLLAQDPTRAVLVLREIGQPEETSESDWLPLALEASRRALSTVILKAAGCRLTGAWFSMDGSLVVAAADDNTLWVWAADGSGTPRVLSGHSDRIISVAFSPDGSSFVTASRDRTARVWQPDGAWPLASLEGHTGAVNSATFSPDGSQVLTASDDGTARLWRADGTGEPRILRGHTARVTSALFSPDGSRILTASDDGTARLWRTDGSEAPRVLAGHTGPVLRAIFNASGSLILTSSKDRTVLLWRVDGPRGPRELLDPTDRVISAAFSPDASLILTVSEDGTARLWPSAPSSTPRVLQGHAGPVLSATFSPDGSQILTASQDGTALVWRTNGSDTPRVLQGHAGPVLSATFSPDGSGVLTVSQDGTARIWRNDSLSAPLLPLGHTGNVTSATFSRDGSRILTASDDGTARIVRTDGSGDPLIFNGHEESVLSATFSPDGSQVLTGSRDGTARLWSADDTRDPWVLRGHHSSVHTAAFSPDGAWILTASDEDTARLWRTGRSSDPLLLWGHLGTVVSATFSPDGSQILIGTSIGTANLWRADGSGSVLTFIGHGGPVNSVAFSPDGSLFATASDDKTVHVWSTDGSRELSGSMFPTRFVSSDIRSPRGLESRDSWKEQGTRVWSSSALLDGHAARVRLVTFSPDGTRILTASDDHTARVWHLHGADAPVVLRGHTGPVLAATFSPDGSQILTSSEDGTARLWRADGSGAALILQGHTGPVLSALFSPDGSQIFTSSADRTARLWRIGELTARLASWKKAGQESSTLFNLKGLQLLAITPDGAARIWRDSGSGASLSPPATQLQSHAWNPPPALLRDFFWKATTACLLTQERRRYLLEPNDKANEGYARCERASGRRR